MGQSAIDSLGEIMKKMAVLSATLAVLAGTQVANAETYTVSARFYDGGIQGQTLFNGSFDWDGTSLTDFSGGLTQSMWAWNTATNTYVNKKSGISLANLVASGGGQPPVLDLTFQLGSVTAPDANGDVLATVFLVNSTNVYSGGGYLSNGPYKYGYNDGNTPNQNAFFTLAFNAANPMNTATAMNKIVYGDCTAYGLMGPMLTGNTCMTGLSGGGSMGGYPTSLTIAAVPEPETYATMIAGLGLIGFMVRRRLAA
jgi:hypothetical protein